MPNQLVNNKTPEFHFNYVNKVSVSECLVETCNHHQRLGQYLLQCKAKCGLKSFMLNVKAKDNLQGRC